MWCSVEQNHIMKTTVVGSFGIVLMSISILQFCMVDIELACFFFGQSCPCLSFGHFF